MLLPLRDLLMDAAALEADQEMRIVFGMLREWLLALHWWPHVHLYVHDREQGRWRLKCVHCGATTPGFRCGK